MKPVSKEESITQDVVATQSAVREKHRVEVVLPADSPNVGYAITQLFAGDPDVKPRIVVQADVSLTGQQVERLRRITDLDLLSIRNGANPTTILSARILEAPSVCPAVEHQGYDPATGPDRQEYLVVVHDPERRVLQLSMRTVLSPGIWIYLQCPDREVVELVELEKTFTAPVPAAMLSGPIGLKIPVEYRRPSMPQDYGREVHYLDYTNMESYFPCSGSLRGYNPAGKEFSILDRASQRIRHVNEQYVYIVDAPTEGF